jgi:antitoxin component YwqK of YwqJK toxin-antitoxin module
MNYISIHITSFFLETIREHQAVLTSLFLVLLCVVGCNQNDHIKIIPDTQVHKKEVILHPNEGKWYYKNQPFSGFVVIYHKNGVLAKRVGYYNGKKEGLAQKWFPEGSLLKTSTFTENKLTGKVRSWWLNGTINTESNYIDGKKHGIQKKWYANGQLSRQTTSHHGKEEGLQQAWLDNGKIYANYEVKNGRIFGLKRSNLCYQLNDENIQYKNL